MDIRCHVCGEPWEVDFLHDVAEDEGTTFDEVWAAFKVKGCEALGTSHGDS